MFEMKENKGQEQCVFPRDNDMQFIPEFTVIDLRIMTSHNSVEGGYGCKLQQITLHPTTLYSYIGADSLGLIPPTLESSLELADQRVKESAFIGSQLELKNVAFYCQIPANSFISASPVYEGTYRIVGKDGSELLPGVACVDIAEADLFRFTNFFRKDEDDVLDVITFLDFASAAGALSMYVVSQQNYKTGSCLQGDFKGVPLIDSDKFLSGVDFSSHSIVPGRGGKMDEDEEEGEVDAKESVPPKITFPFGFEVSGISDDLHLTVWTNPVSSCDGPVKVGPAAEKFQIAVAPPFLPPSCPDLALMSDKIFVKRGYTVTIGEGGGVEMIRLVFNALGSGSYNKSGFERLDYKARAEKRKAREEME